MARFQPDGEYMSHMVVLYKDKEGVLEICDSSPWCLLKTIEEAGNQDQLWTPVILIYKANCKIYHFSLLKVEFVTLRASNNYVFLKKFKTSPKSITKTNWK